MSMDGSCLVSELFGKGNGKLYGSISPVGERTGSSII